MAYFPRALPPCRTVEELQKAVEEELRRLAEVANIPDVVLVREMFREPDRPRTGDLVFADGATNGWDPGGGRGLYLFDEQSTGTGWEQVWP